VSIAIENVPPYEQISSEPIREAGATLSAVRAAQDEAKKALVEAEQTLPSSQWKDAEAAEQARAEGKPEPKTRNHTAAHEKRIADLEHEQRVADLALKRARGALEAVLAEHGQAWADELTTSVEAMRVEWGNSVEGLIGLHSQLSAALSVARVVGIGELPKVNALPFRRRQIANAEFASPQPDVPAFVQMGDVLAALAGVVEVEPDVEKVPVEHRPPRALSSELRDRADVENEVGEREAFHNSERVAERRRRAEQNRQAGEEALSQSLAG
jgi:hypothetical protein